MAILLYWVTAFVAARSCESAAMVGGIGIIFSCDIHVGLSVVQVFLFVGH
jgi:hypothetical protein